MKRVSILFPLMILLFGGWLTAGERLPLRQWRVSGPIPLHLPAFSDEKNTENRAYEPYDLLRSVNLDREGPKSSERELVGGTEGISLDLGEGHSMLILSSYLSVERWTKGTLYLSLNGLCEVWLDGKSLLSKRNSDEKEERIPLVLTRGKHCLMVRALIAQPQLKLNAAFGPDEGFYNCRFEAVTDPSRPLTIHDVLEGLRVSDLKISASGRYVLISYRDVQAESGKALVHQVIYDVEKRRNHTVLRTGDLGQLQWLPRSDRLSYLVDFEGGSELYTYDFLKGVERKIASGLKSLTSYRWSGDEKRIVYSQYHEAEKPGALKRIYGVDDRLPYFRNRSTLHLIDVASGLVTPLTAGALSASFHDFSPDGQKMLFSTQRMDYSEVPFSKQNLYEMNLSTRALKSIWQDKLYSGDAQYSPDGNRLLVSGGPECFGELGVKVSAGRIPNSYDGQVYLYDLASGEVNAISRDFDPAVETAYWVEDKTIYLKVTEGDCTRLYRYRVDSRSYQLIDLPVEVLEEIDFDRLGTRAVFGGSGVSTPQKYYLLQLNSGKSEGLVFPNQDRYNQIRFGKSEDWSFVNKRGDRISGRVYYPPDYEAGKRYPLIVNYYGGTSPVERTFGGRYPLETWAANGYIVYVLQPSGATGFGQDFSALHVNGWGFDAIDDIIDGTQAFLAAHPMADPKKVGCIGASYGGYTTMLLQTRTTLFKTAVSHAGISSITSYWGEGYWGYSYNTGAAKNSYPWNRKDIFVENSPLYNADRFNNSILLLHGTEDTNVPVGESLQYYAALKLLGKEVEMVLVSGQNHHILDYNKRIEWHHTILSWFDKQLKGEAQQWQAMYPDKNY